MQHAVHIVGHVKDAVGGIRAHGSDVGGCVQLSFGAVKLCLEGEAPLLLCGKSVGGGLSTTEHDKNQHMSQKTCLQHCHDGWRGVSVALRQLVLQVPVRLLHNPLYVIPCTPAQVAKPNLSTKALLVKTADDSGAQVPRDFAVQCPDLGPPLLAALRRAVLQHTWWTLST